MYFDSKSELLQHIAKEKEKERNKPHLASLFFELTNGCNLHCVHCGSNCGPNDAQYLSIELIKRTLKSVKDNIGTDQTLIILTGGEPLLHPQFFDITHLINEMGFRWGMTTNATLINKDVALRLKNEHIMSIGFSLDGNEVIHNKFRGNSLAYSRCIEGMTNFVEVAGHEVTTMVTSVIYKENIDKLDELYDVVKRLKVHFWRPINVEPIGRANDHQELFLAKEDYITLFDYIQNKRKEDTHPIVTYGCSHALIEKYEMEVREYPFFCVAGTQVASILVNGDIYACLDIKRRDELVQGNVNKDDFYEIWTNKFTFFRKDRSNCEYCQDCIHKGFCRGDSAHTWNYDLNKPNLCLIKLIGDQ